jgi:inner membrane protein
MDSISQIVLGGALAAAIAPRGHRRAALLAGAALGTLPDLDNLVLLALSDNPVTLMTVHRSVTHSLFVLPLVSTLIWWLFKRFGNGRVVQAPTRWWWAITAALVTHPMLDAFTVYGTQVWWPLPVTPSVWGGVFIIDPLYTVPLILACGLAWWARSRPLAQHALVASLVLSTGYLGWSLLAKAKVEAQARQDLAAAGITDVQVMAAAQPFTTLLWRVVAVGPKAYWIGERSLVADRGPMTFQRYPSDAAALAANAQVPAVQRLAWFNGGFMRARVVDDELVLSDLRMGLEPDYTFNFAVARLQDGQWQAMPPRQIRPDFRSPAARADAKRRLGLLWQRIWQQPVTQVAQ